MKENKYDDIEFFSEYKKMDRSIYGLKASGEWHEFEKMMPNFKNKKVLDLGCGFGWHCIYAIDKGATSVIGVDISEKMLEEARNKTSSNLITYMLKPIEEIDFKENSFDIVISSLAFHYIKSFKDICIKVNKCLSPYGDFVFSVEHPIFTAEGSQKWYYGENKDPLYWPVDRYFEEGIRETSFLNKKVTKYHRTLTTYIDTLIECKFNIKALVEPVPGKHLMDKPGMKDELRRPMMLLIAAQKIENLDLI